MRNKNRLMSVYKGNELIVTGTAKEVASFLNVSEEHAIYLTYPVNHRRNTGGNRRVAFYIDETPPLSGKLHDFLMLACRLYELEKRPLQLIETGYKAGYTDRARASTMASIRYRKLQEYGYVQRIEGDIVSYIPTKVGLEYYEEMLMEEAL